MSDDLNEIQTKIALLEKDAKTGEQIHRRLEIAIDKLSDCAISLKGMLAQQEQKLTKAEQTDEDIFITLESRRKEWDNDLKELHSRITTNSRELREFQNKLNLDKRPFLAVQRFAFATVRTLFVASQQSRNQGTHIASRSW